MYKLREIKNEYFTNYEIKGSIKKIVNRKNQFNKYILWPIFFTLCITCIIIYGVFSINIKAEFQLMILLFIGSILIIGETILFVFYLKSCRLFKLLKKLRKESIHAKHNRAFKKYLKLNFKTIYILIKEKIFNEKEYKGKLCIILWITITYWGVIVYGVILNNIGLFEYIFWKLLFFLMVIAIEVEYYLKYQEIKYMKEKREKIVKQLTFWDLYIFCFVKNSKYKKLKKEIAEENQDKFFEDHPELDNIQIINYLIEINEKEIIYNNQEINKRNNFLIYQTWIIMIVTWMTNKLNNLNIIAILFFSFPFLLFILRKIHSINLISFLSSFFTTIRENREFIHVLQERKFRLLQQQLENNHLSSIEIDKEKTIDNKLILG